MRECLDPNVPDEKLYVSTKLCGDERSWQDLKQRIACYYRVMPGEGEIICKTMVLLNPATNEAHLMCVEDIKDELQSRRLLLKEDFTLLGLITHSLQKGEVLQHDLATASELMNGKLSPANDLTSRTLRWLALRITKRLAACEPCYKTYSLDGIQTTEWGGPTKVYGVAFKGTFTKEENDGPR